MPGGIAQRLPQRVDRGVEPVIEAHMQIGPEIFRQFRARYQRAALLKQQFEYLKWLVLKPQPDSTVAKFAFAQVDFKCPEAELPRAGTRTMKWIAVECAHETPDTTAVLQALFLICRPKPFVERSFLLENFLIRI
jgi:hypothetical protein